MPTIPDLGIPEVKPAIELYRGNPRQKVSPRFTHARLQFKIASMLDAWATGNGRVGSEWRFYLIGDPLAPTSLVPDVAYCSFARLPRDCSDEAERPTIAPDIAIEILSPDDRPNHVAEKVSLYLENGTACVVVVDPATDSVRVYERGAASHRMVSAPDVVTFDGFRDLRLDLADLFAPLPDERT